MCVRWVVSFSLCILSWGWQKGKENKNMASENHFNQTPLRRGRGWHRRTLYLIRALPVVIGRNIQSGFYWITPAMYWRGFTVIEQLYGRWGDSQVVLIKLKGWFILCALLQFNLVEGLWCDCSAKVHPYIYYIFTSEIHMCAIILWSAFIVHRFPMYE